MPTEDYMNDAPEEDYKKDLLHDDSLDAMANAVTCSFCGVEHLDWLTHYDDCEAIKRARALLTEHNMCGWCEGPCTGNHPDGESAPMPMLAL